MRMPRYFRIAVFIGLIGLIVAGCLQPNLAAYPAAASPLVAVAALLGALGQGSFVGVSPYLLPALVLALPCLALRRVLCRSVCPLGLFLESVGKLRKKTTGSCREPSFLRHFPKLGPFLALFIWLCCLFGVIGLLWLDPFVLFGTLFRQNCPAVYVLAVLAVLAWFAPTFWCRCLCPLGGTQDLLFLPRRFFTERSSPVQTDVRMGVRPGFRRRLLRRRLLHRGLLFSGLAFLFGYFFHRGRILIAALRLRPPGAIAEPFFSTLCSRCGACVQVCPTRILKPERSLDMLGDPLALNRFATPMLAIEPGWCRDDCNACSRACPSGAIVPFTLEEKPNFPMGRAVLTFENCRLYDDVECSVCARECPYEAVDYVWSEEEYRRIVRIDVEKCTGCGRCVVTCPVVREGAPAPLTVLPRTVPGVPNS